MNARREPTLPRGMILALAMSGMWMALVVGLGIQHARTRTVRPPEVPASAELAHAR